ncbi:class I SAM-dependent RNA methyltransferase [Candidatus Saccharibacteria bacterium]|nr:class I SAM-dependent RNA methyltransferase [Candidatus Saccharibacteria bacterium]
MNKLVENANITIDKLVPGGQGIATLEDGKKAFFWNVLPGETVEEYEIFKKKTKYIEAVATKISNNSPHRIPTRDNIALSTSPWQIMDYTYELDQKLALLKESFRQENLNCPATQVQTDGKQWFYRNKMEYSLYWDIAEECIKLAFHQRGTHRKVPIKSSSLEIPTIYEKALTIINDLNTRGEEAYKYQSLLLRANQKGEVSGGLYENGKPHPTFKNLTDTILGHEYSYSPNGFFQINLPVYEMALREIKDYITTDNVLDLYAGVGTIGLSVARDKNLTLVEINKDAFAELERNCMRARRELGIVGAWRSHGEPVGAAPATAGGRDRYPTSQDSSGPQNGPSQKRQLRSVLSKSEEALDFIQPDQTVIVDPLRAGCDIKLLEKFLEVTPEKIIYLSCNPSTQARDLRILAEKYKIEKITPFNFVPRTPHLENLAILSVL